MRIQALSQGFKMLQMGDFASVENIYEYISQVITIVNQIWALGHMLEEAEVASKVLWSLALKFDFVAVAIEGRYQNSLLMILVGLCKLMT